MRVYKSKFKVINVHANVQGVPKNMGFLFPAALFRKVVFQFKQLTPKTASPGISKMWSTLFHFLMLRKIIEMFSVFGNF